MNSVSHSQKKDSSKNTDNIKIKNTNSNSLNSIYKMKLNSKLKEPKIKQFSSTNENEFLFIKDNTIGLVLKQVKEEFTDEIKEKMIQVLSKKDKKMAELKVLMNIFINYFFNNRPMRLRLSHTTVIIKNKIKMNYFKG